MLRVPCDNTNFYYSNENHHFTLNYSADNFFLNINATKSKFKQVVPFIIHNVSDNPFNAKLSFLNNNMHFKLLIQKQYIF